VGDTRIVYWIRRLSEIALVGWLGMLLLLDLAIAVANTNTRGVPVAVLCGGAGIIAVLLRRKYRVRSFLAVLAVSLPASLFLGGVAGRAFLPGLAETGSILILTVGVLRWVEPVSRAVLLSGLSVFTLLLSAGARAEGNEGMATGFLSLTFWTIAAGTGGYLRYQRERRTRAVHAVRRAERLELARELHDLVAHHITGIVVQAQAARTVAELKPEAVVPSLDAIATAGADALLSMRRLVTVLRAPAEATRSPGSTLHDLHVLVERFSADGPRAGFEVGQGFSDQPLAPEAMTTLHRVLQESLTNIRRHAPGTSWVEVDLRLVDRWARLRIRNYDTTTDVRTSRLGGGFGLVGMAERVEALGGRLSAGPVPGVAWQVLAEIPA
jgi:signal transduction histidine kinase